MAGGSTLQSTQVLDFLQGTGIESKPRPSSPTLTFGNLAGDAWAFPIPPHNPRTILLYPVFKCWCVCQAQSHTNTQHTRSSSSHYSGFCVGSCPVHLPPSSCSSITAPPRAISQSFYFGSVLVRCPGYSSPRLATPCKLQPGNSRSAHIWTRSFETALSSRSPDLQELAQPAHQCKREAEPISHISYGGTGC